MKKSSNYKDINTNQVKIVFLLVGFLFFSIPLITNAKLISVGTQSDFVFFGNQVGIGTTAPGSKLEIDTGTSTNNQLRITGAYNVASAGAEVFFRESNAGDYGFRMGLESSNNRFYINSVNTATVNERLSIQRDSGNVGIGIVTPTAKLHVSGAAGLINTGITQLSGMAGAGNVVMMADDTGTLFSVSPTTFTNNTISISTLFHIKKWFTPNAGQTISTSGTTVTILNPVSNFQFTSGMVGSKLIINGETRIIATYVSTSSVTVDSAYSTNYSGVSETLWGVYSKSIEMASDGSISIYSEVGSMAIRKRSGDTNTYIPALLDSTSNYYLPSSVLYLDKDFPIKWSDATSYSSSSNSVGLRRSSTSTLEVYDGTGATPGTTADYRDFNVRNFTAIGNVGIGTTAPSDSISINVPAANNKGITFKESDSTTYGARIYYSETADQLRLNTINTSSEVNGIAIARGTGNVGIGTTAPNAKLYVSGQNVTLLSSGADNTMLFGRNVNEHLSIYNNDSDVVFESVQDENTAGYGNMIFRVDNDGTADGFFAFRNKAATEFVRINSAGNVGIGTTVPGALLEVKKEGTGVESRLRINAGTDGAASSANVAKLTFRIVGAGGGGIESNISQKLVGSNFDLYIEPYTNTIFNTGKVGIGSTNPTAKLHILDKVSNDAVINLEGTTDAGGRGSAILFNEGNSATEQWDGGLYGFKLAYDGGYNYIYFEGFGNGTSAGKHLTIERSSGNIGIGTTTPTQKLELVGSLKLQNTVSATTGVIYKGATAFAHDFALPGTNGSNNFFGTGSGNFTMTGSTAGQGSFNTGVGPYTLDALTTGAGNNAMGFFALSANTTGGANVANGIFSLATNTTGSANVAAGIFSLFGNTTGDGNTAIGYNSGYSNTTGSSNVALGYEALYSNTVGTNNTAIGRGTLYNLNITAGAGNNTAIGYNTALGITTGTNNTIIGANVTGLSPTLANRILIADGAGSVRIYADNNGNVGIGTGTTTPAAKLDVSGTIKLGTAGTAFASMGTCTIASTAISTTPTNYTCTGVPASTAVAVSCSGAAAQSGSGTLYCRATGTLNQVACNTSAANTTAMTWTCSWVRP